MRVPGRALVLFVLPRDDGGPPRLGVTATRRVGSSVVRNRTRRLVREAFRKNRAVLGSWDVVVNVRTNAVEMTAGEIERDFVAAARRAARRLERRSASPREPRS